MKSLKNIGLTIVLLAVGAPFGAVAGNASRQPDKTTIKQKSSGFGEVFSKENPETLRKYIEKFDREVRSHPKMFLAFGGLVSLYVLVAVLRISSLRRAKMKDRSSD